MCSPLHPDTTRLETDRVTGEVYVACTPLPIDVAVVHAHAADADGNTRVDPKLIWMDSDLVRAAEATVITVEAVTPRSSFTDAPARTTYPGFVVDAVVHAPWGAYPTSNYPSYTHHEDFFEEYLSASRRRDHFSRFLGRTDHRSRRPGRLSRGQRRRGDDPRNHEEDHVSREVPGAGCTVDELMVVTLAREFTSDTRAFNGAASFIPVCAYRLARKTHAPGLVWAASSIAIDADPPAIPESHPVGRAVGRRHDAIQLPVRLLGPTPRELGTTRSRFAGRRSTGSATSTTRSSAPTPTPRSVFPEEAEWRTSAA